MGGAVQGDRSYAQETYGQAALGQEYHFASLTSITPRHQFCKALAQSPRNAPTLSLSMTSLAWYCSEPRLAFGRTVVLRYRYELEARGLAPATINLRLAACTDSPVRGCQQWLAC